MPIGAAAALPANAAATAAESKGTLIFICTLRGGRRLGGPKLFCHQVLRHIHEAIQAQHYKYDIPANEILPQMPFVAKKTARLWGISASLVSLYNRAVSSPESISRVIHTLGLS